MTGVDKQLQYLHELISAGVLAGGGSNGDHCGGMASGQQQAAAEVAGKDTATAVAQQAAQDEYAKMEERVSRLEAILAETVDNAAAPAGSVNAEGSTGAAEISRGRSPSPNPTRTPPLSPPPPPQQEAVPAAGEVGNEAKLLGAVEEGTTAARRASELAQEALQVGKEAVERSERTGEASSRWPRRLLAGGALLCVYVCVCVCGMYSIKSPRTTLRQTRFIVMR